MNNKPTTRKLDVESSLKRIAWAYGCAKKGSPEEERVRELLMLKVATLRPVSPPKVEPDGWGDEDPHEEAIREACARLEEKLRRRFAADPSSREPDKTLTK